MHLYSNMRIIWKFPFDSHQVILSGLNKCHNSWDHWDAIFKRFYKMYKCMCSSKNETVSFLAAMSRSDCRSLIARNIKFICDKWIIEPLSLQYRWNKDKLSVLGQEELLEAEDVVAMVKKLTNGIYNRF